MGLALSEVAWHLVRDGKPYGPWSDLEMLKFIERGHLEANDLLWRDGFNEWRPATIVFPELQELPNSSHTDLDSSIMVAEPLVVARPFHRRARSPKTLVLAPARPVHRGARLRKTLVLVLFLIVILGGPVSYIYFRPDWPLAETVIFLAQFFALQ